MEPREDPPLVAKLRSLLNRSAKIEITDGRVFIGQFMCIDNSKNIILNSAYEYRPSSTKSESTSTSACQDIDAINAAIAAASSAGQREGAPKVPAPRPGILKRTEEEEKRFVGLVMIPGHHIIKAEMDCSHVRRSEAWLKLSTMHEKVYK